MLGEAQQCAEMNGHNAGFIPTADPPNLEEDYTGMWSSFLDATGGREGIWQYKCPLEEVFHLQSFALWFAKGNP